MNVIIFHGSGKQVPGSRQPHLGSCQIKAIGDGIGWKDGWLFDHGKIDFST